MEYDSGRRGFIPCFDAIISALSIHHLEQEEKQVLFQKIQKQLPVGGVFVNYDQFCGESELISKAYDVGWMKFLGRGELSETELTNWRERQ